MRKLNNNGFTLVELMAVLVLLSLIVSISGYSITTIIKKSKEKDYQLLVKEIKNAVELYYQECNFVDNDCKNNISLGFLVNNGYLKGNDVGNDDKTTIVNPNNNINISGCNISFEYKNGSIVIIEASEIESCTDVNCCPLIDEYTNN